MPHSRLALVGVNALLIGLIAAGCSDGDGGDSDRSDPGGSATTGTAYTTEEMCEEFDRRIDSGRSDDYSEVRSFIVDLHERGLPEGAPADVRDGLDTAYEVVKDADTEEQADAAESELPKAKSESMTTFTGWVEEQCGESAAPSATVPSELATEIPSDLPTDIPSIDPSDIPSDLESMFSSGVPSEMLSLLPSE